MNQFIEFLQSNLLLEIVAFVTMFGASGLFAVAFFLKGNDDEAIQAKRHIYLTWTLDCLEAVLFIGIVLLISLSVSDWALGVATLPFL